MINEWKFHEEAMRPIFVPSEGGIRIDKNQPNKLQSAETDVQLLTLIYCQ